MSRGSVSKRCVFVVLLLGSAAFYFFFTRNLDNTSPLRIESEERSAAKEPYFIDVPLPRVFNWIQGEDDSEDDGEVEEEDEPSKRNVPDFSQIKRNTEPVGDTHDKWIVITTISAPTEDVKFLATIEGWRVLVIGDTKTPDTWSHPNCVFLSVAAQESMGVELHKLIPYRSYTRKNLGYLYAIGHGARVIYEVDDDNRPLDKLESFELEPTMSGLMFAGEDLFNPYHHFGHSTLWPRGYPLGAVGAAPTNLYRLSTEWAPPAIQQGIVNGDPDMDAIFRLTRKRTISRLEVRFDPAAPTVIVPEGVFSPFNSQNTLFRYEAMWAMLLPTTTTFRMCDIWRSYWAQRLLWEIGGHLGFIPPNAYQERNAHNYMEDADDEELMYFHTDRLIKFLTGWSCPQSYTLFQCVYLLSAGMAEEGFWEKGDIEVARVWLEDLIRNGYQEPKRVPFDSEIVTELKQDHEKDAGVNADGTDDKQASGGYYELAARRLSTLEKGTIIQFAAAQQDPPSVNEKKETHLGKVHYHLHNIARTCENVSDVVAYPTSRIDTSGHDRSTFYDDVLLIVAFNFPNYYSNVKYLESIYRPLFSNIAYCGDDPEAFQKATKELKSDLTFIYAPVFRGIHSYLCFVAASQMGYNVKGYLSTGDDLLLNVWNFQKLDKDRMWSNDLVTILSLKNASMWAWWGREPGRRAYQASVEALGEQKHHEGEQGKLCQQYRPSDPGYSEKKCDASYPRVKDALSFAATLKSATGGDEFFLHSISDLFYMPTHLAPSAAHYFTLFGRKGLMLELAIPMTMHGLSAKSEIQYMKGDYVWLAGRDDSWKYFDAKKFFLHPIKLSDNVNLQKLCMIYLPQLLTRCYQGVTDASLQKKPH